MTNREERRIIDTLAHYLSTYNYYIVRSEEEKAKEAIANYSGARFVSFTLDMNIEVVKTDTYYCVIGYDLGGGKYYVSWCTTCDLVADNTTYKVFDEFVNNKISEGYKVYQTDGNKGMMKIG